MKTQQLAAFAAILGFSVIITWSVARGQPTTSEADPGPTYTPTVAEWLQVWTNANFGRNDSRRTIGFIVDPNGKKVTMTTLITAGPDDFRRDPGLQQKLAMEADMVELQVKAYAKRFGFEVDRQNIPYG